MSELEDLMADRPVPVSRPDYPLNDSGNAARLLLTHAGDMFWLSEGNDRGRWIIWNGLRWRADEDGLVERWAYDVALEMSKEARERFEEAVGDKGAQQEAAALMRFATRTGNDGGIRAMLRRARTYDAGRTVAAGRFDTDPAVLGLENGILELYGGGHLAGPAARTDYVAKNTGTPLLYGAKSARWDGYQNTFLPDLEMRRFVQKIVGYGMFGRNTEGLIVFLQGGPNTGKSSLNNMIAATFGEYAATLEMTVFRGKFDVGPREDVADIVRARFALSSETGGEWELHSDQIKRFTGGDPVSFSRKNMHQETAIPEFLPIIATNAPPKVKGADRAAYSRLCVIPFESAVPKKTGDAVEMASDADARAAFLAWAVEGWDLYCAEGLGRETWPEAVRRAGLEYEGSMSDTAAFVADCCEVGADYSAPAGTLYEAYRLWCEKEGMKPSSNRTFGMELGGLGFEARAKREKGRVVWSRFGLQLPEMPSPFDGKGNG
ncbi:DNA primase family protein [Actinomadura litoris]|uniref:SF3 helicase domain-containing protein n=1 Tax=Actinomadura litoris TaxID=2678616 RepID=A0A7K1L9G1_9ACTN|nr:phage/plasmid primase, P4 family [Actinomadura litoris]MUN40876.1 hypothetical protein [Actinomadura litoris]